MEVRPATKSDIPTIMQLERLEGYDRLVGRWEADEHAREIESASSRYFVGLEGGGIVAFAILQNVGAANQCIGLRRIIAKDPARGVGSRFLQAVLQICFNELAAHRVELRVRMDNERARHVYAKAGFFEEGVLRDYQRGLDGSFHSLRLMSLLRPDWQSKG